MLLTALLAFLLALGTGPIPTEGPPPAGELTHLRQQLIAELNQHRAQYGLSPLTFDDTAEKAAQFHAEEMEQAGEMRHEDASGRSPLQRFEALGGRADYYGENIGYWTPGVVDPVLLWHVIGSLDAEMMAEKPPNDGHRRNILSQNYSAVGIGIAVGPHGVFISEDFLGYRYEKAHEPKFDATAPPG
jgi:uncharacterized protein YkwD